jgi:hypothetical protein
MKRHFRKIQNRPNNPTGLAVRIYAETQANKTVRNEKRFGFKNPTGSVLASAWWMADIFRAPDGTGKGSLGTPAQRKAKKRQGGQ